MVGGLALSQLLTLYTTPVVYLYLARLQAWMQANRTKRAPEMESAEVIAVGAHGGGLLRRPRHGN
jgi:hypothetical protein